MTLISTHWGLISTEKEGTTPQREKTTPIYAKTLDYSNNRSSNIRYANVHERVSDSRCRHRKKARVTKSEFESSVWMQMMSPLSNIQYPENDDNRSRTRSLRRKVNDEEVLRLCAQLYLHILVIVWFCAWWQDDMMKWGPEEMIRSMMSHKKWPAAGTLH